LAAVFVICPTLVHHQPAAAAASLFPTLLAALWFELLSRAEKVAAELSYLREGSALGFHKEDYAMPLRFFLPATVQLQCIGREISRRAASIL
jgi:hypothetical protein